MPGGTGDAPPAVDQGAPAEAVPTKRATAELKAILEALIFASPDPLTPRPRRVGRIGAEDRGPPAGAVAVALEDLDRRRLAGAVGAEEAEHLADADVEADPADGLVGAVALAQILDLYRGRRQPAGG